MNIRRMSSSRSGISPATFKPPCIAEKQELNITRFSFRRISNVGFPQKTKGPNIGWKTLRGILYRSIRPKPNPNDSLRGNIAFPSWRGLFIFIYVVYDHSWFSFDSRYYILSRDVTDHLFLICKTCPQVTGFNLDFFSTSSHNIGSSPNLFWGKFFGLH